MEGCNHCKELKEDLISKHLGIIEEKNEAIFESGEMIEFMHSLNVVLSMPCVKKFVLQHFCAQNCVVCKLKKMYQRNQKIEFRKEIFNWFPGHENCRLYREQVWLVLNELGISREAFFHVEFKCGMSYGVCGSGVVVNADNIIGRIDPFYKNFIKSSSIKVLRANSEMKKKANQMFEFIKQSTVVPNRTLSIQSFQECCTSPSITIRANESTQFFYFEIDWKLIKKINSYKIAQILVTLPSEINFGGHKLHLHSILSDNNQNQTLNTWRKFSGTWFFDGAITKKCFTWFDTILYLAFSEYTPKLILYESTNMPDLTLIDEEIIKIEQFCLCQIARACNCTFERIKYSKLLERVETNCNYCKSFKIEGEKCSVCGFNEGNWICEQGHNNIFTSFSCDHCNLNRCHINNKFFKCEKCGALTNNQLFCRECPIKSCASCDRVIFPGQTTSCVSHSKLTASYKSRCTGLYCVFCNTYNDDRLD